VNKKDNGKLESAIEQLRGLSKESQKTIASLINRLASTEGITAGVNYRLPAINISLWITKLRANPPDENLTFYLYNPIGLGKMELRVAKGPIRGVISGLINVEFGSGC
jgi:hypothetical protein